jgi:hypothetical protein
MAGLAWADTIDLTDEMAVGSSPLKVLQQALETDLDDIRQILGAVVFSIEILWVAGPEISDDWTFISPWSGLPLRSPRAPLYQRLSTYRI